MSQRKIFLMFMFTVGLSAAPLTALAGDKTVDQQHTYALLARVERLSSLLGKERSSNALFSNQNSHNIAAQTKVFQDATALLSELEECISAWKDWIAKNPNNKTFRVFLGTAQLAQYSIYARRDELLAVLKLRGLGASRELPAYETTHEEWEAKAASALNAVQDTVAKGLKIEPTYKDMRIVQVELNVLRGDYEGALKGLDSLESEGYVSEDRAFLHTWRAHVKMKLKDRAGAVQSLNQASGYMEPPVNADWALSYKRALESWAMFHFVDFQPLDTGSVENLRDAMDNAIESIRVELHLPVDHEEGIPQTLAANAKFGKLAEERSSLLFSLANQSSENLSRYTRTVTRLDTFCRHLESAAQGWDRLARQNKEAAFYYLLQKSVSWTMLLRVATAVLPLVRDPVLKAYMQKRAAETGGGDSNADFVRWRDNALVIVPHDLTRAIADQPSYLPLKAAQFEFDALVLEPAAALDRLDALAVDLRSSSIPMVGDEEKVDAREYFAAWRSYLQAKSGRMAEAARALSEAKDYRGMEAWKADQEKFLYLKNNQARFAKSN